MPTLSELIIKIGADASGLHNELGKTQNDIQNAFGNVSPVDGMTNALTGTTGAVEALSGKFVKLAGLAAGGFGLTSLVSSAVEAGENVYQLGQRLGITTAEAAQMNRILKQTGGDVDTAAKSIMRLDSTLAAGGKSGEKMQKWLDVFGVSIKDAEGNLLPLNKQLENLSEGYVKAQKAGHAQEFLMNTLGTRGLALTKTLQQYAEAKENAARVQSIGLDVNEMHEVDREMKVMSMQMGQIKLIVGNTLAPIAAEVLPKISNELAYGAKLVKEHKDGIITVSTELIKVLAIYKSIQAARSVANKVGDAYSAVRGVLGGAKQEAQEEALTKAQERAIKRRERAIEAAALKEQKAYAKSVQEMEISEEEKTRLVAEHAARRTALAEEAAARERAIMTAMFQEINLQRAEDTARAAESENAKATAAQVASAKIVEANTASAASNNEIVLANEEVVASEAQKGEAAQVAGAQKVEASAAAKVASEEETLANESLTVSEGETGVAAEASGVQKVAAETASKGAIVETTTAQNIQKAAVVETGVQAQMTGAKMATAAGGAIGPVRSLTSAVWTLAMGWWGVAAAIAAAVAASAGASQSRIDAERSKYTDLDGESYTKDDSGQWHKVDNPTGATIDASTNTGDDYDDSGDTGYKYVNTDPEQGIVGAPNDDSPSPYIGGAVDAETSARLDQKVGEDWLQTAQGKQWAAEQARAEAEAQQQQMQEQMRQTLAGLTQAAIPNVGGAGQRPGRSGTGTSSTQAETPKETVYSLLAQGSAYAPYANEIQYVAKTLHGYDPNLLAAVLMQENDTANPYAVSSDNAHFGLGQISADISNKFSNGDYNDPNQNILAAGSYLAYLLNKFDGDIRLAVAGYNAGEAGARGNAYSSYTEDVLSRYNSASTWEQDATGKVSMSKAPQYADVPIGEEAAKNAKDNSKYKEGSQWMGGVTGDATIQCDSYTANVYNVSGIQDIGGYSTKGTINDAAFKAAGAYHSVKEKYTPEAGDLVDSAHHVGIYLGNNMVRSRDSSGGITTRSLQDWDNLFGIQGYGSIRQATGGMTVRKQVSESQKASEEAYKKYIANLQKLNNLTAGMANAVLQGSDTNQQKDRAKILEDVGKKQLEINRLKKEGLDVSLAEKELDIYKKYQISELEEKYRKLYQSQADEAAKSRAASLYDYRALARAEYDATIHQLDEERKKKEKELMKDKNDAKTKQVIDDEYYAKRREAADKFYKSLEESSEKEIQHLEEVADLAKLVSALSNHSTLSDNRQQAMQKNGQRNLAKEYVKIWEAAHGTMSEYITDVSDSVYSSLSDSMAEFVRGTKTAKGVFQDFGNSVLSMMAKIAAQRVAASWMENIMGMFAPHTSVNTGLVSRVMGTPSISTGNKYDFTAAGYNMSHTINGVKFAEGGIVTAPTIGLIGEAGHSEAVIPLTDNNLRAMSGGGKGGVVVNITNKTDSNVKVSNSSYNEDMGKWVLDVVVDGATRNRGGFGANLKTALGGV